MKLRTPLVETVGSNVRAKYGGCEGLESVAHLRNVEMEPLTLISRAWR